MVSLQRAQEPAGAAQHNPFEGNPALAVAYAAALAAIEGAGQGAPSLARLPERGPPLLPPLPFPSVCQQPLLYMPAYSLVGLGTRLRSTVAPYLVRRRVRSVSPRTVERSSSSVPCGCTCSWAGLGVKQSVDMPTRPDGRFWMVGVEWHWLFTASADSRRPRQEATRADAAWCRVHAGRQRWWTCRR